jgi:hypothetical protein
MPRGVALSGNGELGKFVMVGVESLDLNMPIWCVSGSVTQTLPFESAVIPLGGESAPVTGVGVPGEAGLSIQTSFEPSSVNQSLPPAWTIAAGL